MPDVPAGKTVVAESGISGRDELEELERVGVDAVLIGGALMSAPDPEAKVAGADRVRRRHPRTPLYDGEADRHRIPAEFRQIHFERAFQGAGSRPLLENLLRR